MSTTDDTKRGKAASKRAVTSMKCATSALESDGQQPAGDREKWHEVDLTSNPIPASLRKRGITRVFTNKAPCQELGLPPDLIGQTFGKMMFERLMVRKQAELDEQEKKPCTD